MRLFRNPAFLAAVSVTVLLAIYLGLVAERAIIAMRGDSLVGKAIGAALLVLPLIGAWYLVQEWRLGTAVQRMADVLDAQGRLPAFEGEANARGKLSDAAAEQAVDMASRGVELAPKDWVAWFHLGYAYDAAADRSQARKCLRYAAELYRGRG